MAGIVSAANFGEDPRLSINEADATGTTHTPPDHDILPPDTHGHNTIYLDDSITFENYHYWANRSREFEKHIRTDNQGLAQIFNLIIGKKLAPEEPKINNSELKVPSNTVEEGQEKELKSETNGGSNGDSANGSNGAWAHGVTEAEWEQAQRAVRTATWGE
jgi:hypothetical protein